MVKRIAFNIFYTNIIAQLISFKPVLFIIVLFISIVLPAYSGYFSTKPARASAIDRGVQDYHVYLPLIYNINFLAVPIVNIPKIENDQGDFLPEEAATFWFGKVTSSENYADVRMGYFQSNLWIWVSIIDRRLWYDVSPTPEDLTKWDSVSLFLNVDGTGNDFTDTNTYRFDTQLNWWEDRANYQASYRASAEGWSIFPINFETHTNWWSFGTPNQDSDSRAWVAEYIIPFQSLGFAGTPPEGTDWRLGLELNDRDDSSRTPIPEKVWPGSMLPDHPITWGIIHLGLPTYSPPQATNPQMFTLRNGLNGIIVSDGMVGGGTMCGEHFGDPGNYFNNWGNFNYYGFSYLNVQNQGNTDDWPCFSKIYITFPLESLPEGMEVITATLTLHQLGQATGPIDPPKQLNSLIQIWEINQDWDPFTLSWNNAPAPLENLSRGWVGPNEGQLGIARNFDVSLAATRAYKAGEPLRLALYSADFYGPHGKYFFSSISTDSGDDWRPSLEITLGNP